MSNFPFAVVRYPLEAGWGCLRAWWSANALVATDANYIWVKFAADDQRLAELARALPADRYLLHENWLIRAGDKVATDQLPPLQWQPIANVLQFRLPWIGDLGTTAQLPSVSWQLVRGGDEQPLAGVLLNWDTLTSWVDTAPQSRLDPLRYCLSHHNGSWTALVLGTPVPPLAATYLVGVQRILIPAGFHWIPALDANCVERSFQIGQQQWLFWQATDRWCLIDDSTFVPLSRGSVRSWRMTGST